MTSLSCSQAALRGLQRCGAAADREAVQRVDRLEEVIIISTITL